MNHTNTARHTGASLPKAAETLAQALTSAVQNTVLKHLAATGATPRDARAAFKVRTDRGAVLYTVSLKRVGGAA